MKQIIAVVRPYLAEVVLAGLAEAQLEACSVREVKGYGRQKNYLDQYGDSEYSLAFLPKVEIELWVDDDRADEIVRQLVALARTGRMGDGKIFRALRSRRGRYEPEGLERWRERCAAARIERNWRPGVRGD